MPRARCNGAELYYEIHGSGPELMLVCGLGGVATYWNNVVPAFAEHFRVILHDHRGTGRSERVRMRYSVDQMAADTLALMDVLGVEKAHLLGHSTGGAIGQTIAVEHPERLASLVLFATWARSDPWFRRLFEVRKTLLEQVGVEAYTKASALFMAPNWWMSANFERIAKEEAATIANAPPPEIIASRIDAICAFDILDRLGSVTTPALVVCARDDQITPPYLSEQLAAALPRAELKLLERGGHACSQTAPDDYLAAVLPFLLAQAGTSESRPA